MIDPSRTLGLTTMLTRSWMSGVDFGGKKWSGGRLAAPNMTVICAIASNQDPPGTSIDLFRPWGLSVWTAALSGPHLDDDRARLIRLPALSLSLGGIIRRA